ncbi:MAG: hypothetical protein HOE90_09120 [Bacteriovoracaceae bacterium]|jgi:membrane-bound lytic murein transglycosylase A|nr:hypothetical protein [Bacteriovoracaceae bacterium]
MKLLILLPILLYSCARAPLKEITDTFSPSKGPRKFSVLNRGRLKSVIDKNIDQLELRSQTLRFGKYQVDRAVYINSLLDFKKLLHLDLSQAEFEKVVKEKFDVLEVYGKDRKGEVLVTGYYTPVIDGSKEKGELYSTALLKTPEDLVTIKLNKYYERFEAFELLSDERKIGQFVGRLQEKIVVPYYSREEIDYQGALGSKKLELAYVDPIEAFFMQIQGSGGVKLNKGETIYLHYDQQNGHKYHAIGKDLLDVIPIEEMSMDRIKNHLRSLRPNELQDVLIKNPSYVFFSINEGLPRTYFGTRVEPGLVIATDDRFFPKGALAYLEFDQDFKMPSRFVFDQDKGGGIRGGGRVDLYVGEGLEAGNVAGPLKELARLYYFLPKGKYHEVN